MHTQVVSPIPRINRIKTLRYPILFLKQHGQDSKEGAKSS